MFNGGDAKFRIQDIDCILLYEATSSLPCEFLDALRGASIPLIIHSRNLTVPSVFLPDLGCDTNDILTVQILHRENGKKKTYIARQIVRAKLKSTESFIAIPSNVYTKLSACRNIAEVRSIEAAQAKRYWSKYYTECGVKAVRRDTEHPINQALNACSVFMASIIMRWCLYHRLSLSHGYLHEQTSQPALIYDLIEPYRIHIDDAVRLSYLEHGEDDEKGLINASIQRLKERLDERVYTHVTRETCNRSALLHGAVLALRAYLTSDMDRLVLPIEGKHTGGRPIKVSYSVPGGLKKK